jgi:hypothetical protein
MYSTLRLTIPLFSARRWGDSSGEVLRYGDIGEGRRLELGYFRRGVGYEDALVAGVEDQHAGRRLLDGRLQQGARFEQGVLRAPAFGDVQNVPDDAGAFHGVVPQRRPGDDEFSRCAVQVQFDFDDVDRRAVQDKPVAAQVVLDEVRVGPGVVAQFVDALAEQLLPGASEMLAGGPV